MGNIIRVESRIDYGRKLFASRGYWLLGRYAPLFLRNAVDFKLEELPWYSNDLNLTEVAKLALSSIQVKLGLALYVFPKTATLGDLRCIFFGNEIANDLFQRPFSFQEFKTLFEKTQHEKWGNKTLRVEMMSVLFPNSMDVDAGGQIYFKPYVRPPVPQLNAGTKATLEAR